VALVRQDNPDFNYQVRWLPFFLNQDTPPEGEPYLPFLLKKFGGQEQVNAIFERVRAAGHPYGLEYAFEKIQVRANTVKAHRLIHWAQAQGDATALIKRLFAAQFQRGEHVGDTVVLSACAAECGYDPVAVTQYLDSGKDDDVVRALEQEVRDKGIRQVPTYIIEGNHIIVGAEDPAILAKGIRAAIHAP